MIEAMAYAPYTERDLAEIVEPRPVTDDAETGPKPDTTADATAADARPDANSQWASLSPNDYDIGASPAARPNNSLEAALAAAWYKGLEFFHLSGADRPNRGSLKGYQPEHMEGVPSATWGQEVRAAGAAFDPVKAAAASYGFCTETTGKCLHSVAESLTSIGFNVRAEIDQAREKGFAPHHSGSYWASDIIPTLEHDSRFKEVATGYGGQVNQRDYKPKVGDMAVWSGGDNAIGHIMLCVGCRPDGSAIWKCDFTAKESNWTGLKNPEGHGGELHIFRQKLSMPLMREQRSL